VETTSVLRITWLRKKGNRQTLKLEGQLLGPWITSLREACAGTDGGSSALQLDLASLTYVDSEGFELLRDLVREGIEIGDCSSFVGELLQRPKWQKSV
jgi:ABC-type transporter Mla MlaB component